jgi:hypothetical protein
MPHAKTTELPPSGPHQPLLQLISEYFWESMGIKNRSVAESWPGFTGGERTGSNDGGDSVSVS